MPDPEALRPARIFLALWPDAGTRDRLAHESRRLHQVWGGRMTRPETIHLTLVFIGNLARDRLPVLIEALRGVSAPAFETVFDRAGCWTHNRIGFLSASPPPQTLSDLVAGLEGRLARLGIAFDRRPYKPHVTLLRNAKCESPAESRASGADDFTAITWAAREFVLVESASGPRGAAYHSLARFPLS